MIKQSPLKNIGSVLLAILTFFGMSSSPAALALSDSYREKFEQNDIVFYNPESNCTPGSGGSNNTHCVSTGGGSSSDGGDITWIGDSYSVEAVEKIKAKLPNVDLGTENSGNQYSPYSYIQYGKHLDWISNSSNNDTAGGRSGIDILQDIINAGNLRSTLVLALGTNDVMSSPSTKNTLEKIDGMVKDKGTKVIILTAKTPEQDYTNVGNTEKQEFTNSHDNFVLADWVSAYKAEYFPSGDIHPGNEGGYDAWLDVILNALGSGGSTCTAGLLSGNTIEERIWNWFVNSKIEGVYNNPAVIAGILGNLYVESGYNPFMVGSNGGYRGLHMLMDSYNGVEFGSALKREVDSAVGKDFWKFYGWWSSPTTADEELAKAGATQEQIDTSLRIQLEWLTTSGNSDMQRAWQGFVDGLSHVSYTSEEEGARSYAELFLGIVENAYDDSGTIDGTDTFKDSQVQSYVSSFWHSSHTKWQGAIPRRNAAVDAYKRLSNSTTGATPTSSSDFSSSSASTSSATSTTSNFNATSTGGFTKYNLTEDEIWDLTEVAVAENSYNDTAIKNELSIMANLYEAADHSKFPTITKYIGEPTRRYGGEGWFATFAYVDGVKESSVNGTPIDSHLIELTRDVLVNGNRTLPVEIVEHDCVKCGGGVDHAYNDESRSDDIIDSPDQWIPGKTTLVQDSGGLSGSWIYYDFICGINDWHKCDPIGYYPGNKPSSMPSSSNGSSSGSSNNCPDSGSSGGSSTNGGVTTTTYNGVTIAFPIGGATKSNISGGRGSYTFLSNIPCNHSIGCHYGEGVPAGTAAAAFDVCYDGTNKQCPGAPVVAITSGTITRTITTTRNGAQCNHVRIMSDYNNKTIAYMHLEYDATLGAQLPAGTHVEAGTLIGHVSNVSACHDNSTPHVHIDMNPNAGEDGGANTDNRDPEIVKLINAAWEALPEDDAALAAREASGGSVSGEISDGGLTFEQAKQFMRNYGANKNGSSKAATDALWDFCNGGGSNCVTFSAFFLNKFTSTYVGTTPGNGYEVVGNLGAKGVSTGTTPKPFAVFSWSNGGYGHTGVILGIQNGEYIVGHASCSNQGRGEGTGGDGTSDGRGSGSGFVLKSSDLHTALLGGGTPTFAYPTVDTNKISQYLQTGE